MNLLDDEKKKRYEAFWNHDAYERATVYLTTWKPGAPSFAQADITGRWADVDYRARKALYDTQNTVFLADAFPTVFTNFGPGSLAACIGGSYKWGPDTVWFDHEPIVTDWEKPPEISLLENSEMYRLIDQMTMRYLNDGKGRFYTSISDIGGTFDIIAALRGTQDLLMDLFDYGEEIKGFLAKLQPLWERYYKAYAKKLIDAQGCMTTWMPIYSEKTYYPLQCDFSSMISPDMFEEFVLPDLKYQTEYMDRSIYHWDGPGEIPHLDHLLSLPRLNAIQWTPGAGADDVTDEKWYDLYDRIQSAGKGIVLLGADPNGIEKLLHHIHTKGLFFTCYVQDEKQGEELMKIVQSAGVK